MKTEEQIAKARAGYMEGVVSIVINTALFAVKFWAGIVSGSIALVADAWHTMSDTLSSIVVIIGVKLSSKKADAEHPFGHGRWEQIAALIIAFILAVIAYDFAKDSVLLLKEGADGQKVRFGIIAIVVTVISIVVKELLAQYAFYLGRKSGNLTVKADGWHHRSDALSSVVVLAGIFAAIKCPWLWFIDGVLGLVISIMLFYAVYEIAKEAVTKLLGEPPSKELVEEIKAAVDSLNLGELNVHHLHVHNYENHKELTMHIRLDGQKSIEEGHKIASIIENKIGDDLGIDATIHVEPLRTLTAP